MGCVMQVGEQSNNVARNAIMASRLPESVPGTSIDRQCGSSQQALHFAAQAVMSGTMDLRDRRRRRIDDAGADGPGLAIAGQERLWHLQEPGASRSAIPNIVFSQFTGAEMMAEKYGLSKDELDEYLLSTATSAPSPRPRAAKFKDEIIPLQITRADGSTETHTIDEGIRFDVSLEASRA